MDDSRGKRKKGTSDTLCVYVYMHITYSLYYELHIYMLQCRYILHSIMYILFGCYVYVCIPIHGTK